MTLFTNLFPQSKCQLGPERLLQLLLGAQVVCVSTFLLATVDGARMKPSVTFAADHLVAVVLLGELSERRLDDSTAQTQHQVKSGLFLDVVVGQSASVLQLFPGEDQTLLIRRDSLLVLDLCLDIFDRVAGLDLEGDGFPRQSLHEDLHVCGLSSNIPFRHENDPDESVPTYKRDYRAFRCRRDEPTPKAAPAQVTHADRRLIREEQSETGLSFRAHPPQPRPDVSRWTHLRTSFQMPTSSGEDGFVTTASEYRPHGPERLQRPLRAGTRTRAGALLQELNREKTPRSVQQDSYSAPQTSQVDRRCTLGPDPEIPTIKGDGRPRSYETDYKTTFDRKPLSKTPPVTKHVSAVCLGDKDRICERQSTHSASFARPALQGSAPALKERPQLRLGFTSSRSWSCTSRDTYSRHQTDPVVRVRKNKNLSTLPKGDMDPDRDRERMSFTTSSTSFTEVKAAARPEPEAGLRTKSSVHFSPDDLQSSYYSTTSSEHYSAKRTMCPPPASYRPSDILRGPDAGPSLTTAQVDYVSFPLCKAELSSVSKTTTNIKFPLEAELCSTTHRDTYTPKHTRAPRPAQNQLHSHILMR